MKALRRISSTMRSAALTIGRRGARLASERLRALLGTGAILIAAMAATAVPNETETPAGFTGIGPVVSGSVAYGDIPSKARKFLERHCDGHAIVRIDKEFASDEYDVRLANGIDLGFNGKGNVVAVEAPDGYCLSPILLKAVVPGKLYQLLDHNGFSESVSAVHRDRMGYRLDIADPVFDQVCYDTSGVLTMIVDK